MRIVTGIFLTILVALLIVTGINVLKAKKYKARINKLQTEIVRLNDLEPETIKVTESEIVIKYKDRTITKEIVKEGYIEFNLSKYRAAITRTDSLKRVVRGIQRKVNALVVDTADGKSKKIKYLGIISSLTGRIDKLREETSVIIEDTGKDDIVYIKRRGICFRPMIGAGYSSELVPYGGVKLLYWGKFGLSLGSTSKQAGVGLSRRISDLIPFTKNTELLFLIGEPYKKDYGRFFIGAAVSL